jgi:hypothetical protein
LLDGLARGQPVDSRMPAPGTEVRERGRAMTQVGALRTRRKNTARVRACRQRVRDGEILLTVKLKVERMRDVLLSAGLLEEWNDDDKRAISAAFQRAVDLWMSNEERKLGD